LLYNFAATSESGPLKNDKVAINLPLMSQKRWPHWEDAGVSMKFLTSLLARHRSLKKTKTPHLQLQRGSCRTTPKGNYFPTNRRKKGNYFPP
jgi:hypothetical protein